jgi:hypothetical protein
VLYYNVIISLAKKEIGVALSADKTVDDLALMSR